jgi:hypothetical protein
MQKLLISFAEYRGQALTLVQPPPRTPRYTWIPIPRGEGRRKEGNSFVTGARRRIEDSRIRLIYQF